MTDGANITIGYTYKIALWLAICRFGNIGRSKGEGKVMHISSMNSLQTATDGTNITPVMKQKVLHLLSIGILIFDLSPF